MEQKNLFEVQRGQYGVEFKTARDRDPQTSHQAAAEVGDKLPALRGLFLDVLRKSTQPMTAAEVGHAMDGKANAESIRKRAHELVRLGLIVKDKTRPCNVTGKNARTYKIKNTKGAK